MKTNQTNHIQITVIPTSLGYAIKTRERGTDDFLINLVNPQSELLEKAVAFIEDCIKKQANKNSFFENTKLLLMLFHLSIVDFVLN